jgi:septal ring factor EnvC (AmiA/AmiB activator)
MLESNTWDVFIINSTLYKLLITNQEKTFQKLISEYEKIKLEYIEDSLKKIKLNEQKNNWNTKLNEHTKQLNNFNTYQNMLDKLMVEKKGFINKVVLEYEKISAQLTESKSKIISLEMELNAINQQNVASLEQQEKIKSKIVLKKESRKIIRNEILKLIENSKKFEGLKIKKLKGKLPWPMNGEIITKFGKYTNPDTKVVIDYDLIELQPMMTKEEKIIYLAKQINPNNPNKSIVKKFQNESMNLKNGDRGFGVFGPQTTKMWKKYNKININNENELIYAIHDGIIENINFINPIVGVVIIIRHDNDYFSVYNGNLEVSVMKGSIVKSGHKIASIKKQNILSFQLWQNNTPINPEKWLVKK